jgi:hypothetical protein
MGWWERLLLASRLGGAAAIVIISYLSLYHNSPAEKKFSIEALSKIVA